MGCTASTDANFLLQIAALKEEMEQQRVKANEQQNLLRFKVEVLVNMLAVEEKRSEENIKRTETLQWLLAKNGINEDSLNTILLSLNSKSQEQFHSAIASAKLNDTLLMPDVGTVVEKMREEFSAHRDDILHAFAREDGKIVSVLPADAFVKQVCEVTENLSATDAKVLAMRFDDGNGGFVSVTEFMDFFVTPPSVRSARAAASAVRMSLDLFSLNVEMLDNINNEDEELLLTEEELDSLPVELRKTHYTDILDRGAKRLLIMWPHVRDELAQQFSVYTKKNDIEKIIEIDLFKNTLDIVCGGFSELLDKLCTEGKISIKTGSKKDEKAEETPVGIDTKIHRDAGSTPKHKDAADGKENKPNNNSAADSKHQTPQPRDSKSVGKDLKTPTASVIQSDADSKDKKPEPPRIEPLIREDIEFLCERFEVAGLVHFGQFLEFFDTTFVRFAKYQRRFKTLSDDVVAQSVSPFTYSSEWNALKASSLLRTSKQQIVRSSRTLATRKQEMDKAPKAFTAPKQLPPAPKLEAPKVPEKPPKLAPMETPVQPKKEEEPKKEEVPAVAEEKNDAETTETDEKKEDKKEDEKKEEKPEEKPAAPVVKQSGCFFCSLGGKAAQPQPNTEPKSPPALPNAEAKTAKNERDTPLHKQTPPPLSMGQDEKPDLPPMKHSASPRGYRIPRGFDVESTSSDDAMHSLPNREGLGHGRNDDTPVVQPRNKGSRFRRREENDFAHEKKVEEEPEVLEEDQRYGDKK